MKNSMLKQLALGTSHVLAGAALFSLPVLLIANSINRGQWERVRRDAAWIADADHNRVITSNEWASVYQALGKPYSNREGMDLTYDQLNHYVDTHTH